MPSPGDVWDALVAVNVYGYKSDTLLGHLIASLGRLLAALAIAIVTAVPLGLLSGLNKHVRSALNPIIEFYRPLPPLAYYTLLVLWLGIGDASKITLLFLACFAPIYVACVAAVLKMPASYTTAARTLGANTSQVFKLVVLPYCLPDVFTGVRTAVGVGYSTLVAAEMVAATSGIGWMVLDASNWLRYDVVFVGCPIWWGVEPRIVDSFLDAHDFSDKVIVPFATSGGSGIGAYERHLQKVCPAATFRQGRLLNGRQTADSVRPWVKSSLA